MVSVLEKTDDEDSVNRTYKHRYASKKPKECSENIYYLGSNVCDRARCDLRHSVNACVSGSSGFGFFINGTRRRKYVFIGLNNH